MARSQIEVAEQLLLCYGATQIPRTTPAERERERERERDKTLKNSYQKTTDANFNAEYVWKVDQTELNGNRYKL